MRANARLGQDSRRVYNLPAAAHLKGSAFGRPREVPLPQPVYTCAPERGSGSVLEQTRGVVYRSVPVGRRLRGAAAVLRRNKDQSQVLTAVADHACSCQQRSKLADTGNRALVIVGARDRGEHCDKRATSSADVEVRGPASIR